MRLFLYVFRDYLKFVMGSVVLFVSLVVMFDFIHKTTKYFERYQPKAFDVIKLYAYQIPIILNQALPIASLLAGVITMVLLSRTNEVTAMRAAGMGPLRVSLPVALGGLLLSFVSLGIGEFLVPYSATKMHYVKEVVIENKGVNDSTVSGSWMRDQDRLINFSAFDPIEKVFTNLRIVITGINFRPKEIIEAKNAIYIPENDLWRLNTVQVTHFRNNGSIAHTENRNFQIESLPVDPKKLKQDKREPAERSLHELYEMIKRGEKSGADVSNFKVEIHSKFAFHFAAFVVALMGLRFAYRSERNMETVMGVVIAIGAGLSYWVIMTSGNLLAHRGVLPPYISAWLANVGLTGFALYGLRKSQE